MPRKAVDGAVRLQSLNLKTTQDLRDRMEAAAAASGRALTHEVEARLSRSFDYDYLMGDTETALVVRAIGAAIHRFEVTSGNKWTADDATQTAAYEAVRSLVEALMKPRSIDRSYIPDYVTVDPDNLYMRQGLRNMALDRAMEELRAYRNQQERELIDIQMGLKPARKTKAE